MMQHFASRTVWATALVLGAGVGFLAPKPAEATWVTFYVELWPGGGSTLQCGWH
jgi:hypothetical protein